MKAAYNLRRLLIGRMTGSDRMTTGYVIVMFGLGLALLIWGSNLLVESAVALAGHFQISEVVIGATIVSLGTTLPETLFSAAASWKGLSDMALGNALGSILCNTGLIAGLMLLLRPIFLGERVIENLISGVFFLTAGYLVYVAGGLKFGGLTRGCGILLVGICLLFIGYTLWDAAGQKPEGKNRAAVPGSGFGAGDVIRLVLEAAAIYEGADLLVKYGPGLARIMGAPEILISLTFVALGTSLPELVTSLAAWKKAHSALSLGNIIGADSLNFVLVGGISALIHPINFPDSILRLELPFIFLFLSILCIPSLKRRKAGRMQGLLLLAGYGIYLFLLNRF